jgi:hypothetical protein
MLYSATAQTLIWQVERAHPGYTGGTYNPVAGLADAVILLGFTLLDVVLVVSARQLELRKRGHV